MIMLPLTPEHARVLLTALQAAFAHIVDIPDFEDDADRLAELIYVLAEAQVLAAHAEAEAAPKH